MNKSKNLAILLMCLLVSVAITTVASAQYDYEYDVSDEVAWSFFGFCWDFVKQLKGDEFVEESRRIMLATQEKNSFKEITR